MRFRPKSSNRIANVVDHTQLSSANGNSSVITIDPQLLPPQPLQEEKQKVKRQTVQVLDSQQTISTLSGRRSTDRSSVPIIDSTVINSIGDSAVELPSLSTDLSSTIDHRQPIVSDVINKQPQKIDSVRSIADNHRQPAHLRQPSVEQPTNGAEGSETPQHLAKRGSRVRISINSPSYKGSPQRHTRPPTKLDRLRSAVNRKLSILYDVYFGRGYEHQDVLVTTGLILMLIGLGSSLLGLYILWDEHHPRYLMISLGPGMLLLGVVFCLARVIIWQPRICPCLCPKSARSHHRKASRNSAFFTAASAAMTTATAVSIRYGKQSLIEQNDPFIQNYRRVLTSPKSAATAVLFAQKLLKGLKIKVNTRQAKATGTPPPPTAPSQTASSSKPHSSSSRSSHTDSPIVKGSKTTVATSLPPAALAPVEVDQPPPPPSQEEMIEMNSIVHSKGETLKPEIDQGAPSYEPYGDQVLSVSYHSTSTHAL